MGDRVYIFLILHVRDIVLYFLQLCTKPIATARSNFHLAAPALIMNLMSSRACLCAMRALSCRSGWLGQVAVALADYIVRVSLFARRGKAVRLTLILRAHSSALHGIIFIKYSHCTFIRGDVASWAREERNART